jgi:uncharacterized lipoprotein YddW (UPF0748 family)
MQPRTLVRFALLAALTACARPSTAPTPEPGITREMRGLWVATVRNIDWPSKPGLSADQQRAELIDLLDRSQKAGFNTFVFHVRPAADAVYASQLEPWGMMLTGKQGEDPGYDPLAFAVEQAHARGMELHAWINPFRAGNSKDTSLLAPTHMFNTHREMVRVYGSQLWFDPGDTAVQNHSIRVIDDIMQRYDIDGIHADDYFYPYPENDSTKHEIPFPDSATYANSGTTLSLDDWRRQNIDKFLERLYRDAHQIKPNIKVGMSPFGIWRPGNPASVAGFDAYAKIYADSKKWLQSGWVDYLVPQLYWSIAAPKQSFPDLLDWWVSVDTLQRPVWPGLATYRVNSGTASSFGPNEIADQIRVIRQRPAVARGNVMFNATTTLKKNDSFVLKTFAPLYRELAVPPAMPWIDSIVPAAPAIAVSGKTVQITASSAPRFWVVRDLSAPHWYRGSRWSSRVVWGGVTSVQLAHDPQRVLVTPLSASGMLGATAEYNRAR